MCRECLSGRHAGGRRTTFVRSPADGGGAGAGGPGVARLCRYLVHPPLALGQLTYDGGRASYRGRRVHPVSGTASLTLDPLEMLVRLCQHIPPEGFHLTRLYGAYANRSRGARARHGTGAGASPSPGDAAPGIPTPAQRQL